MNEEGKVRPDLVNIIQLVALDDLFHAQLYPAGHADKEPDIPLRGQLDYFFQLLRPVFGTGDLPSRLIERLEPERYFPRGDAAEIAGIIAGAFLEAGGAADHEPALAEALDGNIAI